jgi:hypothetical protein
VTVLGLGARIPRLRKGDEVLMLKDTGATRHLCIRAQYDGKKCHPPAVPLLCSPECVEIYSANFGFTAF